jgi:hypothetical protein
MISTVVTVTNAPTLIVPKDDKPRTVYLHNSAGTTVYIGGSEVTTTNGFHLGNGESQDLFVPTNEQVYGIVASGSPSDIKVLTPDLD